MEAAIAAEGAGRLEACIKEFNWLYFLQYLILVGLQETFTVFYCSIFDAHIFVILGCVIIGPGILTIFYLASERFRLATHYFFFGLLHGTGKTCATTFLCWIFVSRELQHFFVAINLDLEVVRMAANKTREAGEETIDEKIENVKSIAKIFHVIVIIPLVFYFVYCFAHIGSLLHDLVQLFYFRKEKVQSDSFVAKSCFTALKYFRYYILGGVSAFTAGLFLLCHLHLSVADEQKITFVNDKLFSQLPAGHQVFFSLYLTTVVLSVTLMVFKTCIEQRQAGVVLNYFIKKVKDNKDAGEPLSFFKQPGWFAPEQLNPNCAKNPTKEEIERCIALRAKTSQKQSQISSAIDTLRISEQGYSKRDRRLNSETPINVQDLLIQLKDAVDETNRKHDRFTERDFYAYEKNRRQVEEECEPRRREWDRHDEEEFYGTRGRDCGVKVPLSSRRSKPNVRPHRYSFPDELVFDERDRRNDIHRSPPSTIFEEECFNYPSNLQRSRYAYGSTLSMPLMRNSNPVFFRGDSNNKKFHATFESQV